MQAGAWSFIFYVRSRHALSAEFGKKKRYAAATGKLTVREIRTLQVGWWAR
jgi:hypothetical protein